MVSRAFVTARVDDLPRAETDGDAYQLNSTQLNSTQLNSTQLNSTQLNSTQLNIVNAPPPTLKNEKIHCSKKLRIHVLKRPVRHQKKEKPSHLLTDKID